MAKRNAGRRGRPRKRRPAGAEGAAAPASALADRAAPPAVPAAASKQRRPQPRGSQRDPGGVGERPEAPWHPWPFSELLILAGAIATIVGAVRGVHGTALLVAGIGSVVLGTLEFTVREHRTGYRAHSSLIAAVPTAIVHGAIALGLYAIGAPRETWVLVPVAVDVPLFWFLFKTLRSRFADARSRRVFELGRR
jgi:hypothetical protein